MNYRIKENDLGNGWYRVCVQCKSRWHWRNIWRQKFTLADREYALLCAEELKEHLEADI